jgi:hypothetical protein
MSGDPKESHTMIDEDIVQHPLELPTIEDVAVAACRVFKAACLSEQIAACFSDVLAS